MLRVGVNLDLRWDVRGGKGGLQCVLGCGLTLVVVRSHAEVHARVDLRCQQVWATGLFRHQAAPVERAARAHAVGYRRRGPHDQRASHAVALRPDLLRPVDLPLPIKERDEGDRVALRGARGIHRAHQRSQFGAVGFVLEAERRRVEHRSLRQTVEGIGHEDRIAFGSEALSHLAKGRAQTEGVSPDQDAGVHARGRVYERRVAGAVGGLDLDVGFDDRQRGGRCGGRCSRYSGRQGHRDEVAP